MNSRRWRMHAQRRARRRWSRDQYSWWRASLRQISRSFDDSFEHGSSESSCLRVVAAAMIGVDQHPIVSQSVFRRVRKSILPGRQIASAQHRRMRNCPQSQNNAHARACGQFCPQILVACLDLHRQGFIGGRHAFHGVGNPRVDERKSVGCGIGYRAGSQSEPVQGPVQQYSGMISREGPPGSIGAVQARRQTDDYQARGGITKRRNRPAVVIRLPQLHRIQKCGQSRATPASGVKNGIHAWGVSQGDCKKKRATLIPRSPPSIALGLWTNPSASEPKPNLGCEPVRPHLQGKNPPHQPIFLLVVLSCPKPRGVQS